MPDAMTKEATDDAMMKAGMTIMKGGMTLVKAGMETSNDPMTNEGLEMIRQGGEISDDLMPVEEGIVLTQDGIEKSDEAMMDKGIAMLQESLEESEEAMAKEPSVLKLKEGNFRDADSFHRGSGHAAIYTGARTALAYCGWKTSMSPMARTCTSSSPRTRTPKQGRRQNPWVRRPRQTQG